MLHRSTWLPSAFTCLVVSFFSLSCLAQSPPPNILFVLSDDHGVDVTNGYHQNNLMPTTPTLDSLRATGILFENAFATARCSPSRAALMTAKYGHKNGVLRVPGVLDTSHISLFRALSAQTQDAYAQAVMGKWHLGNGNNFAHPEQHGLDYYMGIWDAGVDDYYDWTQTELGQQSQNTDYVTSVLTDTAISWIQRQTKPWLCWLAHVAPHGPIHLPPDSLYSLPATATNLRQYIAMIEAMDHEIGRLLNSLSDSVRDNTLVLFVGDNGTPNSQLRDYPNGHGKATVYQGGVRVPFIVSGAGVTRQGEREAALVNIVDVYPTLLEMAGAELPGGMYNGLSFAPLLRGDSMQTRTYNYTELEENQEYLYAIRDTQYKLIHNLTTGATEFYDLLTDSLEFQNLDSSLTAAQLSLKNELLAEAAQIQLAWSCQDHIQNGDETGIDCGGTYCAPCQATTALEPDWQTALQLFPNPGHRLQIHSERQPFEAIRVFSLSGELIVAEQFSSRLSWQGAFPQLAPQLLLVEIRSGDQVVHRKWVKE